MNLKQKICDAGAKTLAEYACKPVQSGKTLFIDNYIATIQEEIYSAEIVENYEASIQEDIYTATVIDDSNLASIVDETYQGETICQ